MPSVGMKCCSRCGVSKPSDATNFDTYTSRGKKLQRLFCRECFNARTRAYRKANPDKAKEWDRRNATKNKAPGSEYQKRRYRLKDKQKALEDNKSWRDRNPQKVREIWERTYAKHKQKHFARANRWTSEKRKSDEAFRVRLNEKNRAWRLANKENLRRFYTERSAVRRKTDVRYRIMNSVRRRVLKALKGQVKSASISALVGAPLDVVRLHIEAQFKPGMTWENWGRGWNGDRQWHLDHRKPLAAFDLTNPDQMALACNFKNLQPLWADENLSKGCNL